MSMQPVVTPSSYLCDAKSLPGYQMSNCCELQLVYLKYECDVTLLSVASALISAYSHVREMLDDDLECCGLG